MNTKELLQTCKTIRGDILRMIHKAGSGHPGGSLSAVELLTGLYFSGEMNIRPEDPDWDERDRFILSKGHVAPVLYSVLARRGFYSVDHLNTLRRLGSILQGHPHAQHTPGLDCSSGSLGQGLSVSNGLALAFKHRGLSSRVYCLLGDGELQEGQVWEAVMTAAQHKLDNVCAIVDYNHVQLDGSTDDIKNMGDLVAKFHDFGWHVIELDGHDVEACVLSYRQAKRVKDKPTVLVANTIKGKGVSFMENDCNWHGNPPNAEQLERALQEVEV